MSDINPDVPDRPIVLAPSPALPQAATGTRDILILLGALPALVAVFGTRDVAKIVAWIGSDVGVQIAGILFAFGTMLWRQWLARRNHADVKVMNAFTPATVSARVGWREYVARALPRIPLVLAVLAMLGVAVPLGGCATIPTPTTAAVDRAAARYDQVKAYAELVLPYVPADHAARIRLAARIAERALEAARVAATAAEQRAALKEAEAATADLDVVMEVPVSAAGTVSSLGAAGGNEPITP